MIPVNKISKTTGYYAVAALFISIVVVVLKDDSNSMAIAGILSAIVGILVVCIMCFPKLWKIKIIDEESPDETTEHNHAGEDEFMKPFFTEEEMVAIDPGATEFTFDNPAVSQN